jgi:hypothetical protein
MEHLIILYFSYQHLKNISSSIKVNFIEIVCSRRDGALVLATYMMKVLSCGAEELCGITLPLVFNFGFSQSHTHSNIMRFMDLYPIFIGSSMWLGGMFIWVCVWRVCGRMGTSSFCNRKNTTIWNSYIILVVVQVKRTQQLHSRFS